MGAYEDLISGAREIAENQFVNSEISGALSLLADHTEILLRERDEARLALASVREERDANWAMVSEMRSMWLQERDIVIRQEGEIRELVDTLRPVVETLFLNESIPDGYPVVLSWEATAKEWRRIRKLVKL